MTAIEKSKRLRAFIRAPETLLMPDAFDPLSARIIEWAEFSAVQCSGFSMSVQTLCSTEAELGREANLAATQKIVAAVEVPVMADAEDGFGGPDEVAETIAAYVQAGVAGVNIEDQFLGSQGPKRVIPIEDMTAKILAARRSAREAGNPDLLINGRTDALVVAANRAAGLKEAVRRANAYLSCGADLAFIVGVATMEEVDLLQREVCGPISITAGMPYNLKTLPLPSLLKARVARVSLPMVAVLSSIQAMMQTLRSIRDSSDLADAIQRERFCGMQDVMALLKRNGSLG